MTYTKFGPGPHTCKSAINPQGETHDSAKDSSTVCSILRKWQPYSRQPIYGPKWNRDYDAASTNRTTATSGRTRTIPLVALDPNWYINYSWKRTDCCIAVSSAMGSHRKQSKGARKRTCDNRRPAAPLSGTITREQSRNHQQMSDTTRPTRRCYSKQRPLLRTGNTAGA
jgi:hypothetical protein